jgi:roadblock/LC7 domain-containing protein
MVPANSGDLTVAYASPGVKSEYLTDKHVETRSINELYPNAELHIKDRHGAIKQLITDGDKAFKDAHNIIPWTPEERIGHLQKAVNDDSSIDFQKLNKFMAESALQTYAQQNLDPDVKGKIDEVTVAVVRATDGKLYSYTGNKSEIQSTTASSIFGAITAMTDSNVGAASQATNIWEYKYNPERIAAQQAEWAENPKADVVVLSPRGDALERVKKFSNSLLSGVRNAEGDVIKDSKLKHGAEITIIPVNDGSDEASKLVEQVLKDTKKEEKNEHKLSMKVTKFITAPFSNPRKMELKLNEGLAK